MLRKLCIWAVVLLLLIMPVSAQTVFTSETKLGALTLTPEVSETQMNLKNDSAQQLAVYASAAEENDVEIQLYFRQATEEKLIFEGSASSLFKSRMLVCTLETQSSAELCLKRDADESETVSLQLQAVPLNAEGEVDYIRLLVYVCVWMSLAILGAYIVIIISGRRHTRK